MITLNLLPPQKRKDFRLIQIYSMIKDLIILILLITILAAIVLLLAKLTLQNHFNSVVEQSTLNNRYANIFNKDLKIFNSQLKQVDKIQKEYVEWTSFIINFTTLIPENIQLSNITFSTDGSTHIVGQAATRAALLQFEDGLKGSPLFNEVNIPLESLLKRENIKFDIAASVNLKTE